MSEREGSNSSIWTIVAAIGGLLSGVAAVIALFIAQPTTLRLVLPDSVLQEAAKTQATPTPASPVPTASDQAPAQAAVEVASTPSVEPPPPVAPVQPLGAGVTVSLISLAETPDRYVATVRFENATPEPIGVAVQRDGAHQGLMVLTDGVGGSCQFISNGEGWGTLETEEPEEPRISYGQPAFRAVQANGRAQHTLFFNIGRCATRLSAASGLTISGSFVVLAGGRRYAAPYVREP